MANGNHVRKLRGRFNMTQGAFAYMVGVTVPTVTRWENGRFKPSRLARRALNRLEANIAPKVDPGLMAGTY